MMVHLLRPEQAANMPPELLTTLRVVEDAFCCFDTSADGYLEAAEVSAALQVMLAGHSRDSICCWHTADQAYMSPAAGVHHSRQVSRIFGGLGPTKQVVVPASAAAPGKVAAGTLAWMVQPP